MAKQPARAEDEAAAAAEGAAASADESPVGQAGSPAAAEPGPAGPDAMAVAVELRDKLLRTLAEMENLRKRTTREISDAELRGITSFARDMLGVADNMRRALDAVTPEARHSGLAGVTALIEGVELTERELLKALEKNRVRQFTPQGEKFDPNLHQAIFEVPDASIPAGHVVQVVQPGYLIGERVLRPALVGVSKGGLRAPPGASAGSDNASASAQES